MQNNFLMEVLLLYYCLNQPYLKQSRHFIWTNILGVTTFLIINIDMQILMRGISVMMNINTNISSYMEQIV